MSNTQYQIPNPYPNHPSQLLFVDTLQGTKKFYRERLIKNVALYSYQVKSNEAEKGIIAK
jgi:hypothetical protein